MMDLLEVAVAYDKHSRQLDCEGNGHWLVWTDREAGVYASCCPQAVFSSTSVDHWLRVALDTRAELVLMRWAGEGPAKLWLNGDVDSRVDGRLRRFLAGETGHSLVPLVELPEDIEAAVNLLRTTIQLTDWSSLKEALAWGG